MNSYLVIIELIIIVAMLAFIKSIDREKKNLPVEKAYTQRWMFTYNEKAAFKKLKDITDKHDFHLFAKVRLFDLVEPRNNVAKKITYQNMVKSKHVDFVICDSKLVARYIIELDDSSHNTAKRQQRDNFVDEVLTQCNYKVLHVRNIDVNEIEAFLNAVE